MKAIRLYGKTIKSGVALHLPEFFSFFKLIIAEYIYVSKLNIARLEVRPKDIKGTALRERKKYISGRKKYMYDVLLNGCPLS